MDQVFWSLSYSTLPPKNCCKILRSNSTFLFFLFFLFFLCAAVQIRLYFLLISVKKLHHFKPTNRGPYPTGPRRFILDLCVRMGFPPPASGTTVSGSSCVIDQCWYWHARDVYKYGGSCHSPHVTFHQTQTQGKLLGHNGACKDIWNMYGTSCQVY